MSILCNVSCLYDPRDELFCLERLSGRKIRERREMGDEDERHGESGDDSDSDNDDEIRSKLERAVCRMHMYSMYSTGTRKREEWNIK